MYASDLLPPLISAASGDLNTESSPSPHLSCLVAAHSLHRAVHAHQKGVGRLPLVARSSSTQRPLASFSSTGGTGCAVALVHVALDPVHDRSIKTIAAHAMNMLNGYHANECTNVKAAPGPAVAPSNSSRKANNQPLQRRGRHCARSNLPLVKRSRQAHDHVLDLCDNQISSTYFSPLCKGQLAHLVTDLCAKQVEVQVAVVESERHLELCRDPFDAAERERDERDARR